ncbi:putative PKS-like protein biosynthetic cluster, partial [Neopestalotiopsis sp. 37M]
MADTSRAEAEPMAVVGLSFRLPGGADDVDGLWELLESGKPAWTPVPADRWNEEAFHHPNPDDPNGTNHHPGGHFISGDIRDFDHGFFQFTKQQAAATDPQQRMLLELTYEAFESAGISREAVRGTATSVYTAMFPLDYERQLYRDTMELPVYYASGAEKAMLSNRLSHAFDLRGPSMSLDTACSGGLIALHQACQSLRDGESNMAVVAATNLIMGPDVTIGLSNLHMTSSTGRCYPFDDRGEGYGRGEGVVVLIIKRLEDAIRDRDPVRAVIRSTAAGQDGYTPQGITYPNGRAQADLTRTAYARAGLRPEEVVYVEAHGTGTKAGDSEELSGIADVFAAGSAERSKQLYIGSIKGAIGHTESVAGLASLLKATVMLERMLIPPVAGFRNPKPGLPLENIAVPTKVVPWPQDTAPRISINSFGFGGANAHVILEKGPRGMAQPHTDAVRPRLYTFSAHSIPSLDLMIKSHHDWVKRQSEVPLADLSYTLLSRRSSLPYRYSIVAEDQTSLLDMLKQVLQPAMTKLAPERMDIVFVFTGQGSQWAGMGRELLLKTPSTIFRDSILASQDMLHELGASWDLEQELLRPPEDSRLKEAEIAQPATSAVQIALLALLQAQGVSPGAVVGHSSGEIAAAYAAGHLSHQMAIKIAFHRGFMAQSVKTKGLGRGAMLSVGLGEQEVASYINGLTRGKVTVACVNSPRSVTISGDADAVEEVADRIENARDGTFYRRLQVDTAYHSHHMRAVADDYRARLGVLDVLDQTNTNSSNQQDQVVFISSVTGEHKVSDFDAEYWVANLVSPVRFADAVQKLAQTRYQPNLPTFFIEVGPHPSLAGAIRQCLQHPDVPKMSFDYQGPLQRKTGAVASVLSLAGKLFERGVRIRWSTVLEFSGDADTSLVRSDLPRYPWDHSTKHWHESRVGRAYRLRKEPYHDLLGVPVLNVTDLEPRWRHFLSLATLPWLADHVVDGLTIFPGSGYLCMATEAVAQLARNRFPGRSLENFVLSDIEFKRGLVVPDGSRVEVQLSLKPLAPAALRFQFSITALTDGSTWNEYASGLVEAITAENHDKIESRPKREELPELPPGSDTMLKKSLYADLNAVGNTYGPTFAGMVYLNVAPDASLAVGSLVVPDIQATMPHGYQRPHIIHPSTLDIIVHTSLPLTGRRLGPGSIMPVHIRELLISASPLLHSPSTSLDVVTRLTSSHFRTAIANVDIIKNGERILSASGMELRSLAVHKDSDDSVGGLTSGRGICHEVAWTPDLDYMRDIDLPTRLSLKHLVASLTLKQQNLTSLGLGANVDLTIEFMDMVEAASGIIISHDFVDATPSRFDDATGRLDSRNFPIQFRTMRPGTDAVARGFKAGQYDVVLVTANKWLKQASVLVKPGGFILLTLARGAKDVAGWPKALDETPVKLRGQLSFDDDDGSHARSIIIARPAPAALPSSIFILTHSTDKRPAWVSAIAEGLRSRKVDVAIRTLDLAVVDEFQATLAAGGAIDTIIIADDVSELPIWNDAQKTKSALALLGLPVRLVWLAPDDPAPFHQITGIARTAHAENDDLRLTTIHISSVALVADPGTRIVAHVARVVGHVADLGTGHIEREYRVRQDGTIMIPRLRFSPRIDSAVASDSDPPPSTKSHSFLDTQPPVKLSPLGLGMFVNDEDCRNTLPLSRSDVQVSTRSMVFDKVGAAMQLYQYAGIVNHVGVDVTDLAPGDAVVALAPDAVASCLRVASTQVGVIRSGVPMTMAPAFLLDAMVVCYGLQGMIGGTVLVHGVRSTAGRAVVALARSRQLRVTSTAADLAEARLVEEQIGIPQEDILITRRSMHRRSPSDVFFSGIEAVVQTGEDAAPAEVLSHVAPFGSLIVLGRRINLADTTTLQSNVSIRHLDIYGVLASQPSVKKDLMAQAIAILGLIPLTGFDMPIYDVSQARDATRLVNIGVHERVALKADATSHVEVISMPKARWTDEGATYIVSGGLGDLGQRFLLQMAARGARHLAIFSRRSADEKAIAEIQGKLDTIRPGVQLYCLQCDISSEQSIKAASRQLEQRGAPPVRGIIQSAVVMN